VPCNTRDINLRLTARDGRSGVGSADVRVSVKNTGAAFKILSLDTGLPIVDLNLDTGQSIVNPAPVLVTWQVAGTDQPPISCANVNIDLLTFNDASYGRHSIHRLTTMPVLNSGSASVTITPEAKSHPRARIRVKCSNNIFYDISDVDFAITGTDPGPDYFSDNLIPTFFNNKGTTGVVAPACGAVAYCENPIDSRAGEGGGGSRDSGAVDYRWLLLLTGILLLSGVRRRGRS